MSCNVWVAVCLSVLPMVTFSSPEWFGEVELGALTVQSDKASEAVSRPFLGLGLGKALNDSLSLGVGYTFFATQDAKMEELEADLYRVSATYHRTQSRFGYYGRLGVTYWTSTSWYGTEQGVSPLLETGVSYAFTDDVTAHLGYRLTPEVGDTFDVHQGILGLRYYFGRPDSTSPTERLTSLSVESTSPPPEPLSPTKVEKTAPLEMIRDVKWLLPAFEFDQYNLSFAHHQALNQLVRGLKQGAQAKIRIVGYTDEVGSTRYNQRLSERRADSVRQALVDKGLPNAWFTTEGRGKQLPVFSNHTLGAHQHSRRRVEIIIQQFQCDHKCPAILKGDESDE